MSTFEDPRAAEANRLGELVKSGQMTHEQATAKLAGIPPKSELKVKQTDFQLAAQGLQRAFPLTPRAEILESIAEVGVEAWREEYIEPERQRVIDRMTSDAAEAHAASPEGRLAAAEAVSEAAMRESVQARSARQLLVSEGTFAEKDVAALSDSEAMSAAGLVQTEDPFYANADDPVANRFAAEGGRS